MSKPLDPNSKSGFIRQHLHLPTGEIITLAANSGIKVSSGLVGMVRRAVGGAPVKAKKNGTMKKVRASALRKKAPRAKRKYTRRVASNGVAFRNGKAPVNVNALVAQFRADLENINKQLLRDALEGLL